MPGALVFGMDVHYAGDKAYVALAAQTWAGELAQVLVGSAEVRVPYVSGLFCFREGPPLVALVEAARHRLSLRPDLIVVDGHGIAHPRRFGVACWVGVYTGVPTIGCAKETLLHYKGRAGQQRGDSLLIQDDEGMVGAALVTRDGVKPVFVSPGHKVSLQVAVDVILDLAPRYRIPEPLRKADQSARACAKGSVPEGITLLEDGQLSPGVA